MTTITIKINDRTKAGRAFIAMSESFFKGVKGIEIIETDSNKIEVSLYDPEFIAMVKKAQKSKNGTIVDPNDVWGSLGLN